MYGVAGRFCWMLFVSMISLSYLNMVYGRLVWSPSPWLYLMMKGVLFAAASVISFLESLRTIFLTLCLHGKVPCRHAVLRGAAGLCEVPHKGQQHHGQCLKRSLRGTQNVHNLVPRSNHGGWQTHASAQRISPFPETVRGGRIFDGKKTSEEGSSDCRCEEKDPCEEFGAERHWLKDPWEGPIDIGRSKQSPQSHQGMRPQLRNRPVLRLLGLPFRNV